MRIIPPAEARVDSISFAGRKKHLRIGTYPYHMAYTPPVQQTTYGIGGHPIVQITNNSSLALFRGLAGAGTI